MSIKVVFCWSDISGYMSSCWKALSNHPNIDVYVLAFRAGTETSFHEDLMQGISCYLLDNEERNNVDLINQLVLVAQPNVIVFCGWFHSPYRKLVYDPKLSHVKFIMGMDTPWQGTLKQYCAPFVLRNYLRSMDHVVVTGERSWQYARYLGIPAEQLSKGIYGIDYQLWEPLLQERQASSWPKSFLFVGRFTKIKSVDTLVSAYGLYYSSVENPWPLICCGQGPLEPLLADQPGIKNLGFVQPSRMREIWYKAGSFVLPSRFDPWPLALVEAAAAGLPIICSDACGSAVEVVRHNYNGLIVSAQNPIQLFEAFLSIHMRWHDLPVWGQRSQSLAAPYASQFWVQHWNDLFRKVLA